MGHVLQTNYTHMFSDEALPSLNASVSIFSVGLSVSILKNIYQITNVINYDIFVV